MFSKGLRMLVDLWMTLKTAAVYDLCVRHTNCVSVLQGSQVAPGLSMSSSTVNA
jgi:hypothetical protein